MRFARNKEGKRIEVPASMKYEEFKKKYIDQEYNNEIKRNYRNDEQ